MTEAGGAALLDAVLEALDLEKRPPTLRSFEDLFLRFQRRVATETLTRPAGDPESFDAGRFFAEWVDEERGVVCEERARAFEWLAAECAFEVTAARAECLRPWEGETPGLDEQRLGPGDGGFSSKVNLPVAHRAVVASIEGRRILADAGFPLSVLLPLDSPAQEIPTGLGMLSVARADGFDQNREEIRVTCDGRGEVVELLRLAPAPSANALALEGIRRPLPGERARPDASGSGAGFALRVLDDRVLYWRAGRMTVLDAWSRLEYPLPASERAALEKLFALELDGISPPEEPRGKDVPTPATLRVYHHSPISADEARRRIAPDGPPLSLIASRAVRVESSGSGSKVTIEARFAEPVPPEGPGEAVRKTLVFHLVAGLFDLSRR